LEITLSPLSPSVNKTFYTSLFDLKDGERVRTCLQCGTCSGICPFGYIMKFPPGKIIGALRAEIFEQVLKTDTVWMCVSCNACASFCPSNIPITAALMTRTKEEMLLAGNVPSELQAALENTQRYGNPLGESPRKRADWTLGIQPEINILAKTRQPVDVLWFVGDYASYHPRMQSATRALAKILNVLGVKFGILGPEEFSDGDSQRLAGERGLFEMMAQKNGQAFRKYQFKEIITTDPHAFNALKNEYPALGIQYPVRHYTQFLVERLEQLQPLLKNEIKAKVAYHDPCYLGRVNGVFDEPRALLSAIPGVELVEMSHQRINSLCCGGGGGGMWLDGFQWEKAHTRLSEWRIREAVATNAQILAVACPYEPPRFEDATKTIPAASQLKVREIAELLAESMDL
jgi:Fe-S oxidoreductase